MREYTTAERIEYISDKIEFIVEQEPNLLEFIERMINGLVVVDSGVVNDLEKMIVLNDIRIIKDRKVIKFLKDLSYIYSMKELKKNKN